MTKQILFENKEECLEYYRQVAKEHDHYDWDDRNIIIAYSLFKKEPDWFDEPKLTEQERIELEESSKRIEARLASRSAQRQKIHVS